MYKKYDLPAMPFYVGDWLKCPEVRALAPDYRALWFDMICYMWESTERGVMLNPTGKPYSDNEIIRMIGLDNQNTGIWLTHLIDNGVCYRRDDGAIYSKRMVRDEKIRKIRREVGAKGGNPNLLLNQKVNQTTNQNIENEYTHEHAPVNVLKPTNTTKTKKIITYVRDNPPSVDDISVYCIERKNGINPQAFFDSNTAIGWVDKNKNLYRDWKAVMRKWENFRQASTPSTTIVAVKRPVGIVVVEKIAAGQTDRDIFYELAGKYTEFEINEALGHARKDVK